MRVMKVFLRSLTALVLALILSLTSQSMVVAQGQAAAVGEVEICHGLGVVSIPVDAEGRPTGPPVICPDFAAQAALDPAALPPEFGVIGQVSSVGYEFVERVVAGRALRGVRARGPPRAV